MLKAVCQNTLLFHSHRKITARFDGGSRLPTQDGCCLDRWIGNIGVRGLQFVYFGKPGPTLRSS